MESADSQMKPRPVRYSGHAKYLVCRALVADWEDLADIVDVPVADRKRFPRGREPQATWDWLATRMRLFELRPALQVMGRDDLLKILDSDVQDDDGAE